MGEPAAAREHGGQEIIFLGLEELKVGGGAGSDDADDFAADEVFAGAGLLHLIADGDFEASAQQPGDVSFRGVKRDAAHGNGFAALAIAGGERDLQFAGGDDGVFVKHFVEIAQAKQHQRVGVALLDRLILAHQWRGGFDHVGTHGATILGATMR